MARVKALSAAFRSGFHYLDRCAHFLTASLRAFVIWQVSSG
jgi:hypothetical protein